MHDPHWPHCLTVATVGIELEVPGKVNKKTAGHHVSGASTCFVLTRELESELALSDRIQVKPGVGLFLSDSG